MILVFRPRESQENGRKIFYPLISHRFTLQQNNDLKFASKLCFVPFKHDNSAQMFHILIHVILLATPLGQMPLLEFDGNLLYQNTSIARYLGHIVGLAGNDPLENWAIDSVVDALTDLRIRKYLYRV